MAGFRNRKLEYVAFHWSETGDTSFWRVLTGWAGHKRASRALGYAESFCPEIVADGLGDYQESSAEGRLEI